ncbi:MAG: hypothetical protein HC895_04505 [Leptolyngbyaceae cyanobacterium SM1_3_5]|nr:hypothetical protein [Leptolyngbyaceae cyanobacterium SM1_3_5]
MTLAIEHALLGTDPFISSDRIQQIESCLKQLDKEYTLKVYSDANHGFFCHERSSYNPTAAEDAWHELTQFFHKHLRKATQHFPCRRITTQNLSLPISTITVQTRDLASQLQDLTSRPNPFL